MNYRRATLGLALIVVALGIVVWDMRKTRDKPVSVSARSDYRLKDFRMQAFNDEGGISFSLQSPLLERDPEGKTLKIQTPIFEFPGEQGQVWQARAGNAWVSDRGQEVRLRKQVQIIGPVSKRGLRTEFVSEQLSVFPKQHRISSPEWVTVHHGRSILKGKGLEADMKQRRVKLLAEVQARYVPK